MDKFWFPGEADMKRTESRWLAGFLLTGFILLFGFATMARADDITSPMYAVNGIMTLVGNNVCAPSPCTQTIDFSLDVGYEFTDYNAYAPTVSNVTAVWSGPLGSFTAAAPGSGNVGGNSGFSTGCGGSDSNYIGFFDPAGDEFDIHLCKGLVSEPVAPSILWADLYKCETTTCANDFFTGSLSGLTPPAVVFLDATLSDVTVTAIPEPAPLFLLLTIGLPCLLVLAARSKLDAPPSSF